MAVMVPANMVPRVEDAPLVPSPPGAGLGVGLGAGGACQLAGQQYFLKAAWGDQQRGGSG